MHRKKLSWTLVDLSPWVLYQLSLGQLVKPRYDVVQSGTERIFVIVLDPFEGGFLCEIIFDFVISIYISKYVEKSLYVM